LRKLWLTPVVYPELAALVGPTVPDLRGLFLRGHGSQSHAQNNGSTIGVTSTLHQSGQLGQVQGDAGRNITGSLYARTQAAGWWTGAFSATAASSTQSAGGATTQGVGTFNASRVVPTAPENRPVNTAVRYLIRAAR